MRRNGHTGKLVLIGLLTVLLMAGTAQADHTEEHRPDDLGPGLIALGAAIAIGAAGIATGWAQVNIGSAAVGAMAENEELFGKGLILTALPETIVLFGLVIGFLLIQAIP